MPPRKRSISPARAKANPPAQATARSPRSTAAPAQPRPPALDADDLEKRLTFHPVDARRWPDLEQLFEERGGPKSCWCMVWRARGEEARHTDGRSRKRALERRVKEGVPIGLLGYLDGKPVAWCSIAPRPSYRALGGPDDFAEAPARVWSLVCFFVVRALRARGLTRRLIEAAVAHARRHGAHVVEAYPVDPGSPSYRFMGRLPTFKAAGFATVGRAGTRRHVVRLPTI